MTEVSSTRLYLGNLARDVTKADIEGLFQSHGAGEIVEIKLMNGFGFIEYKDAMDARDVVPAFHGTEFHGERLVVQFARGPRRHENFTPHERAAPRPRRTAYRMRISNLPIETSWQDLKDFARQSGLDVVYSEVGRERDGTGYVEYETDGDLRTAVEKLDGREFKGQPVRCVADVSTPPPAVLPKPRVPYAAVDDRGRDRYRSRSPMSRRGGAYPPAPYDEYYDRRGAPRTGYSPRRDDYRRRSPPPRDYYDARDRYGRVSPRARAPPEDYAPPRPRYPEEPPYEARGPPPRRAYEDPYANGHTHARPYEVRPPSPRGRPRSPVRAGYEESYAPRRYW